MGTQSPPHKGDGAPFPIFGPFLLWPNGWMHQDATWYGGRPPARGLCVRCGPSPSSQKGGGARGQSPQFSAHVYCDQTAGWIKMALVMEVGLGPVHIVLDRDAAALPKGCRVLEFSAHLYCGQTAMHQDATWYKGRPQHRRICVRWRPSPPPQKWGGAPNFRPMFIVAKRLDG